MEQLIQVTQYDEPGIGGEITGRGNTYTVLLLNYLPRLHYSCIADMQRHTETDECFILLQGKAILFAAEGEQTPGQLQHYVLEPGKVYNVPRGIWHTQAMTEDAKILLVENTGTVVENSPRCPITQEQKDQILQWGRGYMG